MNATTTQTRHITLDALRGFAVMGILLMNIIGFSMPEMAYFSPAVYGGTETPDIIAWLLSFVFVDGKMRGLFTILFGASMMLVIERAEAKGESAAKVHYSRMLWLALFGLAHYFLIWWGDILFIYAMIGCLAYFVAHWDGRKLIRGAVLIYVSGFVAYVLFTGSLFYLQYLAATAGPGSAMDMEYQETIKEIATGAVGIAEDIAIHQGSYGTILIDKITEHWWAPLVTLLMTITETLPFMMIGMAFYKSGFMTGEWEAARYKKFGLGFTALGLVLIIPIAVLMIVTNFDPLITLNGSIAWSIPSRLLMTIGYAALLILMIKALSHSALLHRIAAAGRAAFSNYLGTSILMTFIFYGWGLGLYGQVDRAELYLFVPSAWIIMLLWSKPWLMRFRYGPLEWLWRSLARKELQSMKIAN